MLGVHLNTQHTEVTIIPCPEETVVIRGYRLLDVYRSLVNGTDIISGGDVPVITSITVEENTEATGMDPLNQILS